MRRRFVTLDVFTDKRFAGNPLAVVLEPDGLDTAAMQTIAREFNLSETVFVFPPADKANRAKLRIFTPARELPFAGHPTVGTAVLLGRIDGGKESAIRAGGKRRPRAVPGHVERRRRRACVVRHSAPAREGRRRAGCGEAGGGARAFGRRHRARRLSGRALVGRATRSPSCRCAASMRSAAAGSILRNSRRAFGGGSHVGAFVFCRETAEPRPRVPCAHVRAGLGRARRSGDRLGGCGVRRLSGGARQLRGRRARVRHRAGLRDGPPEPDRAHAEDRRRQAHRRRDRRRRGRRASKARSRLDRQRRACDHARMAGHSDHSAVAARSALRAARRGRSRTSGAPRSTRISRSCAPRSRKCGTAACCCCGVREIADGVLRGAYLGDRFRELHRLARLGFPDTSIRNCFPHGGAALGRRRVSARRHGRRTPRTRGRSISRPARPTRTTSSATRSISKAA